jgi:histidinol-phosphate phosphatase family protein
MTIDLVIPTLGRPSLAALLRALGAGATLPDRIVLIDDRRAARTPLLAAPAPAALAARLSVLRGRAAGPAAARNVGWRAGMAEWVAFLDDDVLPAADWFEALQADLAGLPRGVGGSQGRIVVPSPPGRRATDWERNVRGLETACWATADMAYRRAALEDVGGFDDRFPRAYREDADLALRVRDAGWHLVRGRRSIEHPVRPAGPWVSVRLQAGNADDALMRRRHGPSWRAHAGVPRGSRARHLAVTAAGLAALASFAAGRRRLGAVAAASWLAGTGRFAWSRIAPGPRTPAEVATMIATSLAIPPAATWHWLRGWLRWRGVPRSAHARPGGADAPSGNVRALPRAVLFDRDGTLVVDVPYNGDPARVVPVPGARAALDRLRSAGVRVAVVSNQSGVGRGLLRREHVDAVNRRIEDLLGPLGPWLVCPHVPEDACECRKPAPALVLRAADALGVAPTECALVGDTGADVAAARAAGVRAVLVPNAVTRRDEIVAAPEVAHDLGAAVDLLLGGRR